MNPGSLIHRVNTLSLYTSCKLCLIKANSPLSHWHPCLSLHDVNTDRLNSTTLNFFFHNVFIYIITVATAVILYSLDKLKLKNKYKCQRAFKNTCFPFHKISKLVFSINFVEGKIN